MPRGTWLLILIAALGLGACARRQENTAVVDSLALREYRDSQAPHGGAGTEGGTQSNGEQRAGADTAGGTATTSDTAGAGAAAVTAIPSPARPDLDTSTPTKTLLSRIRQEEFDLGVMIQEKRLDGVRAKATRIRSLAGQVVAQAPARFPPQQRSNLETSLGRVRTLSSQLAAAGDAGNVRRAKTLFEQMQEELRTIEGVLQELGA